MQSTLTAIGGREALPQDRRRYSLPTPEAISRFVYEYDRRSPCTPYIHHQPGDFSTPAPASQIRRMPGDDKTVQDWCGCAGVVSDQFDSGSWHPFGHLGSVDSGAPKVHSRVENP